MGSAVFDRQKGDIEALAQVHGTAKRYRLKIAPYGRDGF